MVTLRVKGNLLKSATPDSASAPAVVSVGRDNGVSTDGDSASARPSTARAESTAAGAGAAQRVSRETVAATRPRRRSTRGAIKAAMQTVSVDAGEAGGGGQPPLATARDSKREDEGNEEAEEDDMEVDVEGEEQEEEQEEGQEDEDTAAGKECRNRLRGMIVAGVRLIGIDVTQYATNV